MLIFSTTETTANKLYQSKLIYRYVIIRSIEVTGKIEYIMQLHAAKVFKNKRVIEVLLYNGKTKTN